MLRGNRAGLDIPPERAIRWITSNAAKSLGIDDQTGSLAVGKMADVVLWNQDPFSVYAKPLQVYIDGVLRFEWVTRRSIPSRILSSASCWGPRNEIDTDALAYVATLADNDGRSGLNRF